MSCFATLSTTRLYTPFPVLTAGELEDPGHFIAMFFTEGKPESSRSFVAEESQYTNYEKTENQKEWYK